LPVASATQDDLDEIREAQASLAITELTPAGTYRLPGLPFSAGPRRLSDPIGGHGDECAAQPLVPREATTGLMLVLRPGHEPRR
jgi:hypothetical protein